MKPQTAIAIIIPGGIGTGKNNIGVPVLERIVRLLSSDFKVTVFQLYPRNKDFVVKGFELIDSYSPFVILKLVKFLFSFFRNHSQKRFQVVHGFWVLPGGLLAVVMGKLFGIKSVVSVLGGDAIALPEIQYGQLRNPVYRWLIFWTLKQANEVIALTQYLVNNLRNSGFIRDGIRIIPWGIDTVMFSYWDKPVGNPVRFLHIGNLHPVKDQETLLRAFKLISDEIESTLTIIGEGILEQFILSLIQALGLQDKVILVNPLPYEQLPGYYHSADILLHTSLSEGQCEVVTEALSSGVLVCGTKVGLMYDLPECCVSVDVRAHELLANNTLQILRNPQTILSTRLRAHHWSENHSILWTAKKIKELYREYE